jgi:hypothetical protein
MRCKPTKSGLLRQKVILAIILIQLLARQPDSATSDTWIYILLLSFTEKPGLAYPKSLLWKLLKEFCGNQGYFTPIFFISAS